MLKIWGRRNSSNVRKVLWCAEEIGLPYESIEVGGSHGGTQTPEYLAMNPNSLVPVIEDHGLPLWESNTIVRYLSARYALGTLSLLCGGLGFWWALLDREGLTWHDRLSNTRLVHVPDR